MSRLSRLWAPDVRFCLLAFLVGRVAVSALAVIGWYLPDEQPEPATTWAARRPTSAWLNAFAGFERFDAQWYLQIARDGYLPDDPSAAFFPLYPLTVRAVALVTGERWLLAATLVSNVCLLVALVLLHRLTARELSTRVARWAVVLILVNPMGVFLYAPYSESLFLVLVLACLLLVRADRWAWAAAAGALACTTRSTGVVLCAVMGAQALWGARQGWWPGWSRRLVVRLAWSAVPALGTLAYLGYWQLREDWRVPLDLQRTAFQRETSWPWTTVYDGLDVLRSTAQDPAWLIHTTSVLLGLATLVLGVVAVRRLPAPYVVYVVGGLLVPLALVRPFAPFTSVPRYYLMVVPLLWTLEQLTRQRVVRGVSVLGSAALLVLMVLLLTSWHDVI